MEYRSIEAAMTRQKELIKDYNGDYKFTNALNCLRGAIVELETHVSSPKNDFDADVCQKNREVHGREFSLAQLRNSLSHTSFSEGTGSKNYQHSYTRQNVEDGQIQSVIISFSTGYKNENNKTAEIELTTTHEFIDLIDTFYKYVIEEKLSR